MLVVGQIDAGTGSGTGCGTDTDTVGCGGSDGGDVRSQLYAFWNGACCTRRLAPADPNGLQVQ